MTGLITNKATINDRLYLGGLYDELIALSQAEYNNESLVRYEIKEGSEFLYGLHQFIGVFCEDRNLEITDSFFKTYKKHEKPILLEFMVKVHD